MLETFQAQGSNLVNEQEQTDPTGRSLTQKFDFNILTQQKSTYRLQDICLSDADLLKSHFVYYFAITNGEGVRIPKPAMTGEKQNVGVFLTSR